MSATKTVILQINDSITARAAALRIDRQDAQLPMGLLVDRYLLHAPIDQLIREGGITERSADALFAMQDLVYASSDDGQLMGMFSGINFKQRDRPIALGEVPRLETARISETEVSVIDLTIERTNAGYDRNWRGFHKRKWRRHADDYSSFVQTTLESQYGQVDTGAILQLDSKNQKLKFLRVLARRIWESDFENYSRFIGNKLIYKTGDETLRNIMDRAGGICTEKVQALKFLTDNYGLESEYVLAGDNARAPVPVARLREMLTTFDFRFSKRYMRYWQHLALVYDIDGTSVLVDATNGNIPFLFLKDSAADRLLGHQPETFIEVRMVEFPENFYYHRVPQDVPENLLFALEGWIPDADMVQVFDNELGLYVSKDFFVTPIPFRNESEFNKLNREYLNVCRRANLECSVDKDWSLDSPLGQRFADQETLVSEKILLAQEHLLHRYDQWDGLGHQSGLVVIKLRAGRDVVSQA